MNTIIQEPKIIDIKVGNKDDLNFIIKFNDLDLTLYTFEAFINWKTGFQKINVKPFDLINGQIEIEITKTIMEKVPTNFDKTWSLFWTRAGKTREIFKGSFE